MLTGLSRSSSGRVNFRNPCTTSSSRRISLSIISTCASTPCTAADGRGLALRFGQPDDRARRRHRLGRGSTASAPLRIFVRSSSRWIIIAFSGFFTSWAMPAVSRPSATSLRE